MPRLMAEADEVVKLRAICARCGDHPRRGRGELRGPLPPLPRGARGCVPVRIPWGIAILVTG
jgi:hypothetical protein